MYRVWGPLTTRRDVRLLPHACVARARWPKGAVVALTPWPAPKYTTSRPRLILSGAPSSCCPTCPAAWGVFHICSTESGGIPAAGLQLLKKRRPGRGGREILDVVFGLWWVKLLRRQGSPSLLDNGGGSAPPPACRFFGLSVLGRERTRLPGSGEGLAVRIRVIPCCQGG